MAAGVDTLESFGIVRSMSAFILFERCWLHIGVNQRLYPIRLELIDVLPRDECPERPSDQNDIVQFALLASLKSLLANMTGE